MRPSGYDLHSEIATSSPITVEVIDAQIKQAWRELNAEAEQRGEPAPLRTSILTLVVIASGDDQIRRSSRTLEQLVQILPSRVIQISILDNTSKLSASVSAHCAIRSGDKKGCYELIHINAGPNDLPAMPSLLSQLDISDLTTFAWWVGPVEMESPSFRRIASAVERVIIDSSEFADPLEVFQLYEALIQSQGDAIAASDLTWSRLLILRELVAQSFDMPAAVEMLAGVRRIDISHRPDSLAQAMMMAGWLTSRLGFEPLDASRLPDALRLIASRPDGRELQIILESIRSGGQGVRSIRIIGHSAQQSSRVSIRRIDDERASVNIDLTGVPRQNRMVHCAEGTVDQVLGMELVQFGRDAIYEESLASAAAFSRMIRNKG